MRPAGKAEAIAQLLDALHGIAMYNDKGYAWMGHDAAQIAAQQARAQAGIEQLVAEIGESAFPADLLADLRSGRAVRDGDGLIVDRAQACFGKRRGSQTS